MHMGPGAIAASIIVHLFVLGLAIALNHIPPQNSSPTVIYVELEHFFQTTVRADQSQQQPARQLVLPSPTPTDNTGFLDNNTTKSKGVQWSKLPIIAKKPAKKILNNHAKKTYPMQAETGQPATEKLQVKPKEPQPATSKGAQLTERDVTTPANGYAPEPKNSTPSIQHSEDDAYLSENYSYIRDLIAQHMVFPPIARKLGWHGRLTVSFILHPKGQVSAIQIVKSSGRKPLDRSVIAAVKRTEPFPAPKRLITLVVPVSFNLR